MPTQSGTVTFQGIEVPASAVQPTAFFSLTRRHRYVEKSGTFSGLGKTDNIEMNKSDIIAGAKLRVTGSFTVKSSPTTHSTMRWPYDLVWVKLNANGQTSLIDCSGLKLKARAAMQPEISDRGVSQTVGSSTVTQGTLALASESWGVGAGATLSAGTYDFELAFDIPICDDKVDLAGAIFAQTSTMDITLQLKWADASDLFTVTSDISDFSATYQVTTEKYSIPVVGGNFIVPDLSMFHSIVENRYTALAVGPNEAKLTGQGAGKQLLRVWYQTWNGSAPQSPLAASSSNYGEQGWRYGSKETPELYGDGTSMRQINESEYNVDLGGVWGFLSHEFEVVNAFRDTIDMGQTAELRLVSNIDSSVTLTNPAMEYVQEVMFGAGG